MSEYPIIPGRGLVTKLSTQLRHGFLDKNNLDIEEISKTHLELDDIKNNIESYVGSTLHFAFAITVDNFGEKFTKKYLTELNKAEEQHSIYSKALKSS